MSFCSSGINNNRLLQSTLFIYIHSCFVHTHTHDNIETHTFIFTHFNLDTKGPWMSKSNHINDDDDDDDDEAAELYCTCMQYSSFRWFFYNTLLHIVCRTTLRTPERRCTECVYKTHVFMYKYRHTHRTLLSNTEFVRYIFWWRYKKGSHEKKLLHSFWIIWIGQLS